MLACAISEGRFGLRGRLCKCMCGILHVIEDGRGRSEYLVSTVHNVYTELCAVLDTSLHFPS
ncbi:hypothetical protein GQ44DRAFT_180740 [Phaeosphaeriaceae sp. PMI808]|nr:hypothetical protein GQ44DRAFT_180740 [Phaeosphaeriaceae sp. PMI808]